jgi:hypothetical protein
MQALTVAGRTAVAWAFEYVRDEQLDMRWARSANDLATCRRTLLLATALRSAVDTGTLPVDVDVDALRDAVEGMRDEAAQILADPGFRDEGDFWSPRRQLEGCDALLKQLGVQEPAA